MIYLIRVPVFSLFIFVYCLFPSQLLANGFFDQFMDPEDGMLDASSWLLKQKGFLPLPILITEPAVENGIGAAAVFFHDNEQAPTEKRLEPSISVGFGLITGNDSWILGGAHKGVWRNDRIRYLGALVVPSINLDFYGTGSDSASGKPILSYTLEGWVLLQELKFRLYNSKFFAGAKFTYFASENKFESGSENTEDYIGFETSAEDAGLGILFQYDSLDNSFTPNDGIDATLSLMFHEGESVGDYSYRKGRGFLKAFKSLGERSNVVMGWKVNLQHIDGSAPFYALPFISLRGIPMMRYQGKDVADTEVEARWNIYPRWSVLGFAGVGRASFRDDSLSGAENRWAGGTGMRYLTAKTLKLYTGIDIAKGPEEWVFYLQMGNAWQM